MQVNGISTGYNNYPQYNTQQKKEMSKNNSEPKKEDIKSPERKTISRKEAFKLLENKMNTSDLSNVHQFKEYEDYAAYLTTLLDESEG